MNQSIGIVLILLCCTLFAVGIVRAAVIVWRGK